ncbi:MAG: ATP-binding cassette domain-containing protein [Solirubrobacteraceae bacterium]
MATPGQPAEAALRVQGVVMRLPGLERPVLDGADLVVAPGQSVGILGANGAGKTTFLRVVAGLLAPDAGTVALGALALADDERAYHRRVALLSADGGLYARLSVRRHLAWWAAMAFVPPDRRAPSIAAEVEAFALDELLDRRVERLSAGQRQRVRLAMAFLPAPDLVLLDEPESRLDEDALELVGRRMAAHAAAGGITAWAAPEGRAPDLPADALVVLRDGRLEARA